MTTTRSMGNVFAQLIVKYASVIGTRQFFISFQLAIERRRFSGELPARANRSLLEQDYTSRLARSIDGLWTRAWHPSYPKCLRYSSPRLSRTSSKKLSFLA